LKIECASTHMNLINKTMILTSTAQQIPKTHATRRKDFMVLKKSCSNLIETYSLCVNRSG